jgi:hypothetical protein
MKETYRNRRLHGSLGRELHTFEGDEVSGLGWAALNPDGTLEGHIYSRRGDDSAFRAERCD